MGAGPRVLRSPLHGANAVCVDRGLLATASVMLGGTAYDGFSAEPRWYTSVQSATLPSELLMTAGLLGMCLVVALSLHLAAAVSAHLAGIPVRGLAGQFAPSRLPIAAGYVVAHYWSLWVFEGQTTLVKLSDPLGIGANWLGTGGLTANPISAQSPCSSDAPAVVGQMPLLVLMVGYTCGGLMLLFSS